MSRLFKDTGHMRGIYGTSTGHPALYLPVPVKLRRLKKDVDISQKETNCHEKQSRRLCGSDLKRGLCADSNDPVAPFGEQNCV
jgi:hypothetical protein